MATSKGTCGACFRPVSLNKEGLLVRHGWSEAGGQRQVGTYGNVYHDGACFGVGWKPYEVSSDCTKAFLAEVLFPMGLSTQGDLERLATFPDHIFSGKTRLTRQTTNEWDGYAYWQALLRHGDMYSMDVPSYETYHSMIVSKTQTRWTEILTDALYCCKMIQEWAPSEVKTVAKKAPLVHFRSPHITYSPWCRMSRWGNNGGYHLTDQKGEVTCAKCQKLLARAEP